MAETQPTAVEAAEKAREMRARRAVAKRGLRLIKTTSSVERPYMIVNEEMPVCLPTDLDGIEAWLRDER